MEKLFQGQTKSIPKKRVKLICKYLERNYFDSMKLSTNLHNFKIQFENKEITDPFHQSGLRNDVNVKMWIIYSIDEEIRIKSFKSIFYRQQIKTNKSLWQKIKNPLNFFYKRKIENSETAIYESGNIVVDNREDNFYMIVMKIPNREVVKKN